MPEAKIVKYEVFTVQELETDEKGNLIVYSTQWTGDPKGSGKYKVGIKRSNLFPIFTKDSEVKVGFASYQGPKMPKPIEYIATAEQTGKHEAPTPAEVKKAYEEAIAKPTPGAPQPTPVPPKELIGSKPLAGDERTRSMSLSYAKDIMVALINARLIHQITPEHYEEMFKLADRFVAYIEKGK